MSARALTRTVGVLGGGIAAFAAALAFRRALPDAAVTLFVGNAADEPEYAGAAAPYIHRFHRLVGLDPEPFRRRAGAVTVREAEIRRSGKQAFRLVPLHQVPYVDGAALHQLWLRRLSQESAAGPAWAEVARRAQPREDVAEGLGVRFDPAGYLELLRDLAAHAGVAVAGDMPDAAGLASSLDLLVETRAAAATDWPRIEGVPASLDWSIHPSTGDEKEIDTVECSGTKVVWANDAWRMQAEIGARPTAAGRAAAPWQGNTLAIGRAAAQYETCDGQPLAVALAGIARAIELLPRPGAAGREVAEYNRRTNAVHDFLLDWAAERWGAESGILPGLAALRRQFGHRGRIPFRDEDPVPQGQWIGWLLGSGERPRNIDLTAMAVPGERLAAIFAGV